MLAGVALPNKKIQLRQCTVKSSGMVDLMTAGQDAFDIQGCQIGKTDGKPESTQGMNWVKEQAQKAQKAAHAAARDPLSPVPCVASATVMNSASITNVMHY
eukprot:jgi/Chrzof1/14332/UNPLg00605.t1